MSTKVTIELVHSNGVSTTCTVTETTIDIGIQELAQLIRQCVVGVGFSEKLAEENLSERNAVE